MNISNPYLLAALGCGFTFLMTSLGAATIFFIRKDIKQDLQSIFLGFAAGVMIAASVWSLLIPAMEQAQALGLERYFFYCWIICCHTFTPVVNTPKDLPPA